MILLFYSLFVYQNIQIMLHFCSATALSGVSLMVQFSSSRLQKKKPQNARLVQILQFESLSKSFLLVPD